MTLLTRNFYGFFIEDFAEVLRRRRRRRGGDVGGGGVLQLSSSSVREDAVVGTLVGLLSVLGGVGSYTFSFLGNPGNLFSISGNQLLVNGALSVGTDPIIVEADNGLGDNPIQLFSIHVTRVVVGFVPTYELLGF